MSVRASAAVWEFTRAEGTLLNILLKMADWSDEEGVCHPSFRELARMARCNRRTVIRGIAELMTWGEVELRGKRMSKAAGAGRAFFLRGQRTNEYRIRLVDRLPREDHPGSVSRRKVVTSRPLPLKSQVVTPVSLPKNTGGDPGGEKVVASDPASDLLTTDVTKNKKSSVATAPPPAENEATYKQLEKLVHEALDLEGFESLADLSDVVKSRASRLGLLADPVILSRAIASVTYLRGLERRASRRLQ